MTNKAGEIKNSLPEIISRKTDQQCRSSTSTTIKSIDVITNDYDEFLEDKLKRCNERRGKSRMVMYIEMSRFSTISYEMTKVKPIQESMRE